MTFEELKVAAAYYMGELKVSELVKAAQESRDAEVAELQDEIKGLEEVGQSRESGLHKFLDTLGIPRSKYGLPNATDGSYARIEAFVAAERAARVQEEAACAEIAHLVGIWRKEAEVIMEAGDKAASLFANRLRYCADRLESTINTNPGQALLDRLAAADKLAEAVTEVCNDQAYWPPSIHQAVAAYEALKVEK